MPTTKAYYCNNYIFWIEKFKMHKVVVLVLLIFCHVSLGYSEDIKDPWEGFNRSIFQFNQSADKYLVEPVSKGYDFVVPDLVQEGIGNFFSNLSYPSNLISDLLQLNFTNAALHTSQFTVNTILGVGGLFDVADAIDLKPKRQDMALALQSFGLPAGPYLVIPFLGPSTVRDGIGVAIDMAIHPLTIPSYFGVRDRIAYNLSYGGRVLEFIDYRVKMDEALKASKEASLDYYLFMQSAYIQYREGLTKDSSDEDDLFDDDEDW